MKKIALASAIAIATITTAHAAPTVYGKALLTVEYTDTDNKTSADTKTTQLVSNASRIGFKGSENLTANTDLVYQLEYGIDVDNGSANQFYSRNTFVGLSHKQYGTLLAGRHDTPFKLSKGGVSLFDDYNSLGLNNVMQGEYRANNVIAYKSPKLANLPVTFLGAVALSENDTAGYVSGSTEKKVKDNAYSASVTYDDKGVFLGAGYDVNTSRTVDKAWRVAGSVDTSKMGLPAGVQLGAMYQNVNIYDSANDEKSWLVSAKYNVPNTAWAVKAQYVDTTDHAGVKDKDVTQYAFGGEYKFNKNAKGHIYAGEIDTKNVSDKLVVGAGLEYVF